MATQAQTKANRLNAQKSTGPKTVEGKAAVSQNAVKHGLFAAENVIKCEKQADFDQFRQDLLGGLGPVGGVERMLAERVVSLSWRLKRAERMSNEAIDVKIARATTGSWDRSTRREAGLADDTGEGVPELILGWATIRDFSEAHVLERLLMYEKRIESSLYKAMNELQKLQRIRKTEQAEAVEVAPAIAIPINDNRDEAATHRGRESFAEAASAPAKADALATAATPLEEKNGECEKQSQSPESPPSMLRSERVKTASLSHPSAASANSAVNTRLCRTNPICSFQ
jgi:hypothetical protein